MEAVAVHDCSSTGNTETIAIAAADVGGTAGPPVPDRQHAG